MPRPTQRTITTYRMTLEGHIEDIRQRLEKNEFRDEAAVRLGIINRLLKVLGWPIFDVKIVFPEYGVNNGKVDYALCHPPSNPRAFIEVKRVGNIDKGIEQLFEYAYRQGITILVLTDGQTWRFYFPAGEGSYENRKIVEVDFTVGNSEEFAKRLDRYLNYESVKTGKAAKNITTDYWQEQVEKILPEVWNELVQEKNEFLLHAIIDKTKDRSGHEPTTEQVLAFLEKLSVLHENGIIYDDTEELDAERSVSKLRVTMPDGEAIEHKLAIHTFIAVIEKIGIERVETLGLIQNAIPLISTRKDPKRAQHQRGQYYIVSGLSNLKKKTFLEEIAEKLRIDLKVELR